MVFLGKTSSDRRSDFNVQINFLRARWFKKNASVESADIQGRDNVFTKNASQGVIKNIGLKYLCIFRVKGYNFFQEIISCLFFNSLFYAFAAKQQLLNENKNRVFRNVYFENFASQQSSVLQITFCVYFCLGYCFYSLCLIFDEVMTTCIVITRGLYQTNRTIEFEEYILKEDYHGKSSNTVPFVRDPLPRPVY